MPTVTLSEARRQLSRLVDRALAGEVIHLTRRGQVVACLSAPQDAVTRLQQAARGVGLGRLKSRDLIREGRA